MQAPLEVEVGGGEAVGAYENEQESGEKGDPSKG